MYQVHIEVQMVGQDRGAGEKSSPGTETFKVSSLGKAYTHLSMKLFSQLLENFSGSFVGAIQVQLDRAEIKHRSIEYLSRLLLDCLIVSVLLVLVALSAYSRDYYYQAFVVLIPISFLSTLSAGLFYPRIKISSRRRKIDDNLGAAFAFVSAMASADVPISTIMLKLSRTREFGEVSREAGKINRDTELLGVDIFSAMGNAARKSPSPEWERFLQGAVATSTAGARLKPYFVNKSSEYQNRLRISLKKNSESVSVFAETYVTIGVALPLFLIVIVGVMAVVTRNALGVALSFLLLFSFLVLPALIATFVVLVSSVNKEVQIS